MEQRVKVHSVNADGTARVVVIRESACSGDCHKCSGCGAAKETILFDAVNPIGAKPGDVVTVRADTGPVLGGAAVLYMVPLVLFFVGYFLGDLLQHGGLGGGLGFAVGVLIAVVYDRKVAGKKNTVYTITGYVAGKPEQTHTKGEYDVD